MCGRLRLLARDRQVRRCSRPRRSCSPPAAIGKAWKVTSNSWEYTGDGHALACGAGADLIDMECVQFHPTGMVWPPQRARHPRDRGRARRRRARSRTARASGSCSTTSPSSSRPRRPTTRSRGRPLVRGQEATAARRTSCRATRSPARSTPRSRPGAAPRTAACSSTSARAARADYIRKRLPSMYHQFKELADVDITKEPMEVGPTCHYIMGGVRVDADTTAATACPGSSPRARWRAACTARTASAATRSPTCSCSAGAPGSHAAEYAKGLEGDADGRRARRSRRRSQELLAPFERTGGENPYAIHADLQEMHADPGRHHPHRGGAEGGARARSAVSRSAPRACASSGGREYNPGWHLALDLRLAARGLRGDHAGGARAQGEPGRPHPRRLPDSRTTDFGKVNVVVRHAGRRSSA